MCSIEACGWALRHVLAGMLTSRPSTETYHHHHYSARSHNTIGRGWLGSAGKVKCIPPKSSRHAKSLLRNSPRSTNYLPIVRDAILAKSGAPTGRERNLDRTLLSNRMSQIRSCDPPRPASVSVRHQGGSRLKVRWSRSINWTDLQR